MIMPQKGSRPSRRDARPVGAGPIVCRALTAIDARDATCSHAVGGGASTVRTAVGIAPATRVEAQVVRAGVRRYLALRRRGALDAAPVGRVADRGHPAISGGALRVRGASRNAGVKGGLTYGS